ncbi:MAG TPA: CmcI family methyltransferase [Candidatus Omnitrophota bacterium]|nr:CmcI family methyltransferase [Candidatus Omnitrophota bacterium]
MQNEQAIRQYHEWYYNNELWRKTQFLGADCCKSVSDMWNYQEIIHRLKPSLLVEFGTYRGGSALYFSAILKLVNDRSKVLTVDNCLEPGTEQRLRKERHIQVMKCSSTDPKVAKEILSLRRKFRGPAFFILDSDHSKAHVLAEMVSLRPVTRIGDYLIVEDSNINGHPVLPEFGEGPMEAIGEYFSNYPDDYRHDRETENKFGFTFAPEGFLIRN